MAAQEVEGSLLRAPSYVLSNSLNSQTDTIPQGRKIPPPRTPTLILQAPLNIRAREGEALPAAIW